MIMENACKKNKIVFLNSQLMFILVGFASVLLGKTYVRKNLC